MWFIIIITLLTAIVAVWEVVSAIKESDFKTHRTFNYCYDGTGTTIFGIILIVALLIIPMSRRNVEIRLNSFEVQRETLSALRGEKAFETAASLGDVMELNKWLADRKWINSHKGFNWYVPNSIQNVEPIK